MKQIEQTLTSMEVAQMVEKEHSKLLKDIRRYCAQLAEAKIGLSEFWQESTYKDSTGRNLPCYLVTKKGCEFIAHKLTGTKGTAFTAKYINRFHEMEEELNQGGAAGAQPEETLREAPRQAARLLTIDDYLAAAEVVCECDDARLPAILGIYKKAGILAPDVDIPAGAGRAAAENACNATVKSIMDFITEVENHTKQGKG